MERLKCVCWMCEVVHSNGKCVSGVKEDACAGFVDWCIVMQSV